MLNDAMAAPGTQLQNFLDRAGFRGFPWKTALILYTISYGWFWNVRNSYWADDWIIFYDPGYQGWAGNGFAPWMIFNKWLYDLTGSGFLRSATFVFFFLGAMCFYGISKKIPYLSESLRKFATLLFLLLPFNSARVALMIFSYAVAYFFFFFAWYLIILFKSIWIKLLAIFLFFISFQMHSLLLFIALPIIHLLRLEVSGDWRNLIMWVRNNWFLVLLSPTYVVLRWRFWNTPPGSNYHTVKNSQIWFFSKIFVFISVAVLMIWLISRFLKSEYRIASRLICLAIPTIYLGLAAYVLADLFELNLALSYVLYFLGRTRDWQDRHLILQPIGMSLLLCGLLSFISLRFKKLRISLQVFAITICVLLNVGFGLEYVTDYAKQKVIVRDLQKVGYNTEITDYVFIDKSAYLNARGRGYSIDFQYLLKMAYGSKKIGIVTVALPCKSLNPSRLVIIDGEASYSKALRNRFSNGNFGFSTVILDDPSPCPLGLVENRGRQNQIPLILYFVDANKEIE